MPSQKAANKIKKLPVKIEDGKKTRLSQQKKMEERHRKELAAFASQWVDLEARFTNELKEAKLLLANSASDKIKDQRAMEERHAKEKSDLAKIYDDSEKTNNQQINDATQKIETFQKEAQEKI